MCIRDRVPFEPITDQDAVDEEGVTIVDAGVERLSFNKHPTGRLNTKGSRAKSVINHQNVSITIRKSC